MRARTGLTDEVLARAVGVQQATFTRWRNGTLAVHPRHVPRLAKLLGVPSAEVGRVVAYSRRPDIPIAEGTIGALLRDFELAEGLTVQGAYERLEVEVSTYHKWRKNQVVPGAPVMESLAIRLGVSEETVVMAAYRTELLRVKAKNHT